MLHSTKQGGQYETYLEIWAKSKLEGKSVKIGIVVDIEALQRLKAPDFLNDIGHLRINLYLGTPFV